MDFSEALKRIKRGGRLCRQGWNSKNQFVVIVHPNGGTDFGEHANAFAWGCWLPKWIALKNNKNSFCPWVPSIGDLLGEDWVELKRRNGEDLVWEE